MNKNDSLRKKLTITYVLLIVLPFVSLSLVLSWLTFQSQKKAAVSLQAEVMKRAVNEIILSSYEYQSKFSFIAYSTDLLSAVRKKQHNLISLLQSIRDKSHVDVLQEVTLLDSKGMELVRVSRTETVSEEDLYSKAETDEFVRSSQSGSFYYGPVFFDNKSLEPMMNLAVPILDLRSGETDGVIVGQLRLRQMWDKIVSRSVGKTGILYIADGTGKVIAHPNPSVVLRVTKVHPERDPGVYVGMFGEFVILSSEQFRMGDQSFFVVTETPVAESMALSRKTLIISLFMLVLFLILAIIFGIFIVSQIARPIESLAITALTISDGDFNSKADEQGYLEISALAKSFNNMTSQLVGKINMLREAEQELIASKAVMKKEVVARTVELQQANEELEEEIIRRSRTEEFLRRYSQIVNSSYDYISFVGRNYQYLAVNDSYLEALGKKRSEVVSRHVGEIWGQEVFEKEIKEKFDSAFAGHKKQYEVWLNIGEMGKRFYELAMTPYQKSDNEVTGVVVNIRDATAKWNLEKNLRQAEKMKAVGTLASGIAHDFNNVLHNIFGCARVAQQSLAKDSDAYYWLSRLQQVGERAAHLIRQIQTFSRQPEPVKIPLDLQSMIKEVLRLQELSMPKNIEVNLSLGKFENVMADATQIHQVLANLFSNAIQAMSPKGGDLGVCLEIIENFETVKGEYTDLKVGRYAQVIVSDTGYGIEKDILNRVFEPFFTTKSFGKGTGLGLSITHGILRAHGGDISVTSQPGNGTSFRFCLPLAGTPVVSAQRPDDVFGSMPKINILYVDDEEINNEVWKAALQKEGLKVTTAISGKEALRLFLANPEDFDLVVTDQKMPDMTGTELARELVENNISIPIILVTGWVDDRVRAELEKKTIQAVLNKPVQMANLLKCIDQVLMENKVV